MNDDIELRQFGYLTDAPELKYDATGRPVARFRVLTNKRWTNKETGETKERTDGIRWTLFGASAENAAKLLKKGSHVYIRGTLQNDAPYEDKNGVTQYRDSHIVNRWKLLDRKPEGSGAADDDVGGEGADSAPIPE